jgi:FtsH-binding integral membrane protein
VCLRILLFIGSILLQVSMILLASVQGGSWRRSWHWQAASVLSGSFIALSFLRGHVSPSAGGLWRGLLMGHVLLAIAGVVLFWNLRRILQQQEVQH